MSNYGHCKAELYEYFANYIWPGLGLFGESYLLFSVGTLQPVWSMLYPSCFHANDNNDVNYYNDDGNDDVVCSDGLLHALTYNVVIGIIIGMVLLGTLSSYYMGRRLGSIVTASLMCFGSSIMTFSTVLFVNDPKSLFTIMAAALLVFGVGVGGEYPLSASSASERAMEELQRRKEMEMKQEEVVDVTSDRGKRVILIFAMQGMGIFVNGLLLTFMLLITGQLGVKSYGGNEVDDDDANAVDDNNMNNDTDNYDLNILLQIWQIIYAIGTLVLIYVLTSRILHLEESQVWAENQQKVKAMEQGGTNDSSGSTNDHNNDTYKVMHDNGDAPVWVTQSSNVSHQPTTATDNVEVSKTKIMMQHYGWRLFGTSTSWLLWDVAFYGNKLFQASFLLALTGEDTTLFELSGAATLNAFIALLGYYAAAYLVDNPTIGRRNLQQYGFLITGSLFTLCGILRENLSSNTLVIMYFASSFFGQCGPNCTTFLLPAEIFPTEIRTTCHGLSASAGKVGALIAAICFHYVSSESDIFLWSGYCSFIAAVVTFLFIPDTTTLDLYELDKKWRMLLDSHCYDNEYIGPANNDEHLSFWEQRTVKAKIKVEPGELSNRSERVWS